MNVLTNHIDGSLLSRIGFVRLLVCLTVSLGTLTANIVEPSNSNLERKSSDSEPVECEADAQSARLRPARSRLFNSRRLAVRHKNCFYVSPSICELLKVDVAAEPGPLSRLGSSCEYLNFNGFGGPLRT